MSEISDRILAELAEALARDMTSFHLGLGKDGKPWTESVVVVKPGATDAEIETAADTAKKLAAQFAGEVEQAKQDSESLSARFILERFAPKEILEHMDADFAGSCRMPIRTFGGEQLEGETVAEVYDTKPAAVHWVGFKMAVDMLREAGADKKIGIVACGVYWNAMERVKTGLSKPTQKPKEEDLTGRQEEADDGIDDDLLPRIPVPEPLDEGPIDSNDWV